MDNRDKKKTMGTSLIVLTAVFTVIGMFFQTLAVLFGYDPSMQVFKRNSAISVVSVAVLFCLSILLAVLSAAATRKYKGTAPARAGSVSVFLSAAGGCAMLASSLVLLSETNRTGGAVTVITLFLTLASIPAGAYMVLSATDVLKNERVLTALSFFAPIWAAACLMRIYFDLGAAVNDPVRVLFQISFVFVMLALLFELKMRIKGSGFTSFAVTVTISVLLCCCSALSMLLLYFITKTITAGELLMSLSELIICLYLMTRLGGCFKTK